MDTDCNCVHLPYSDGASFAGFRTAPWAVPTMPGKTVTFRGIKNFDGVMVTPPSETSPAAVC